jgi:hypothetical protein
MKLSGVLLLIVAFLVFHSCSNNSPSNLEDEENCVKPTKDPHDVKPMALMMRTMADYCDSMRLTLNDGQSVDSIKYPLMPFWDAEPTDSSNLEPLFYDNAKQFANAYRLLMSSTNNQKENYTAVINQCVHCHSTYCSGPLKRIRKLTLDYKASE